MNDLLNLIASDRNIIPYRRELNKITGGPLPSILLSQIIYWASKYDYKEFYKNIRKPNKRAQELGQESFMQELGYTKYMINKCFDILKGKEFVSVRVDSMSHNTYIKLNIEKVSEAIAIVYEKENTSRVRRSDIGVSEERASA